LFHHHRGVAKR